MYGGKEVEGETEGDGGEREGEGEGERLQELEFWWVPALLLYTFGRG